MRSGKQLQQALASHVSGQSNTPLSKPAHSLSYGELVKELRANADDGISAEEAQDRLTHNGPNELEGGDAVSPVKILLGQIANAMTLVLILAMVVSFAIQSWIEGGVIAAVIIVNIVVGFFQEFNAEKTMDSLRSLGSPSANVIRDGQNITIPTAEVVPGDMVELKTGDTVPADIRLIEAVNFETDETLLTGESLPISKTAETVFPEDTGPGDRLNVAFSSSTVTKGRARGLVFATGMFTEVGSIAAALRDNNSSKRAAFKPTVEGKPRLDQYAQAWSLGVVYTIGRFLGVNVGTPLQKKLSRLAVLLFGVAVVCAIIVLAANNFAQYPQIQNDPETPSNPIREVAIYAVATGLSMIPASLMVVLTITMAAGTKRMAERNVIVRKLSALEALGGVTDICSDKTGTLTQGKMVAKIAWIPSKGTYSVEGSKEPFNPTSGDISFVSSPLKDISGNNEKHDAKSATELLMNNEPLQDFLNVAGLANLATVHETDGVWKARGDPTEIAIQVFAARFMNRSGRTESYKPDWRQLAEYPFDSDIKKMTVISEERSTQQRWIFTKGAVERVLDSCSMIDLGGEDGEVELTDSTRDDILDNMDAIASLGLRCLALASRSVEGNTGKEPSKDRSAIEQNLTFRGLIGLNDPPRPESAEAVRKCHMASIAVHMLTGDHPGTASAIAKQVGILPQDMSRFSKDVADAMVMTASRFDKLTDAEIDALPVLPLVIARCAPQTKVRMIEALHRRKKFCAMTGDGVNDSPSLKKADVGIAMGQSGSDVAKNSSDIILTDDNFASILSAIEEGRRMFENIQKFVLHLLSQNIAQAFVLLIGLAFKDVNGLSVFPLTPVEILWIIMITSAIPDMGLGFEIASPDIMHQPPVSMRSGIFQTEILIDMFVYGVWIAVLCIGAFLLVVWGFGNGDLGIGCNTNYETCDTVYRARATVFACFMWFSLFLAWEMISKRRSFFRMKPHSKLYFTQWMHDVWRNQFLFWAIVFGAVSIFPILYIPVINTHTHHK